MRSGLVGQAPRRPRGRRARSALLWGYVVFAALQIALAVVAERWVPALWQPQYVHKLARLRQRLADAPGQPLVLFMGTSRTLNGLRPAELPSCRCADGSVPVVFNFGYAGAGPLRQVLLLQRLLDEGVHPDHVFLELLPALLAWDGEIFTVLLDQFADWRDLAALENYWFSPLHRRLWIKNNLLPWRVHRSALLARLAPWMLPRAVREYFTPWPLDDSGFFPIRPRDRGSRAGYVQRLQHAHAEYFALLQTFHVSPAADRAVRQFLRLCRERGIGVTLLLMPEGKDYRAWYPPPARVCLRRYLDDLCRDCRVRLVDARTWVADKDFADGHHLLTAGVSAFTRRFGREVYRPVVRHEVRASAQLSLRSPRP